MYYALSSVKFSKEFLCDLSQNVFFFISKFKCSKFQFYKDIEFIKKYVLRGLTELFFALLRVHTTQCNGRVPKETNFREIPSLRFRFSNELLIAEGF